MLKVMTIVGTRPELIKMSRVIAEMDRHTQHLLVHTGQNYDYELNQVFFEDLGIRRPDYFLEAAGANAIQTLSLIHIYSRMRKNNIGNVARRLLCHTCVTWQPVINGRPY